MTQVGPVDSAPAIDGTEVPPGESGPDATPARRAVFGSLREIAAELWEYRDLLYQVVLRDVRIRYKQAVMGFGWAILTPLLIVMAGLVVRFGMTHYAGATIGRADVAAVAVKALAWGFTVGAISFATVSVVANAVLVSKVYFPREVLPVSAVLAQLVDSTVGGLALALLLPFLGVSPTAALVWVPLLGALLITMTLAAALLLSCANLFFRDVKYLVQIGLTFGIFFTPVLFEPSQFGRRGAAIMMLNPVAPLLEGLRLAVVQGHNLLLPLTTVTAAGEQVLVWTPWYLAYAALVSVLSLIGSALVFHHFEFVFAEYV